jgi:hypothetical protein
LSLRPSDLPIFINRTLGHKNLPMLLNLLLINTEFLNLIIRTGFNYAFLTDSVPVGVSNKAPQSAESG